MDRQRNGDREREGKRGRTWSCQNGREGKESLDRRLNSATTWKKGEEEGTDEVSPFLPLFPPFPSLSTGGKEKNCLLCHDALSSFFFSHTL